MSWADFPIEKFRDQFQDQEEPSQDQCQAQDQCQESQVEDSGARRTRMLYEKLRRRLMADNSQEDREDEPPWESSWGD